jgi:CheY-like chemotaxis protein
MVVDADPDVRDIVGISLTRDPIFVARLCQSGKDALATASEWRPDLGLLGEQMPDMATDKLLARLRADRRTAPIRIAVMTARTQASCDYEALGAIGVIATPFDPMALPALLRRFVPFAGNVSPVREDFLRRLDKDARALSACRRRLSRSSSKAAVIQVNRIAHALAGAGGIYGYAGVTCEAASLSEVAVKNLAGQAPSIEVKRALDRLIQRLTTK